MLKFGFSCSTWDFQEENDLVTYFYSASEFTGLVHITSLAKASSSSVRPDLPSLGGWILILDRLAWMSPALLMCHKSATVWCRPGLFSPSPTPPSSPSTQCDFCIRCHGDAAKREENESANLWLPGQTVHLGRVNCTLAVCLCADNGGTRKKVKKGQCDTLSNTMQNTETSYRWC